MRERIYQILERGQGDDKLSKCYDFFIVTVALVSLIPLLFQNPQDDLKAVLIKIDTLTVYLLFFDYILSWMTYDYKVKKHSPWAFITYPFTPLALLNLLAILPSLGLLPAHFAILRVFRLIKVLQYSKSCRYIVTVFKKEQKTLLSVLIIALFYIFVSALIMFIAEPVGTFRNFFHATYWATTALTTVGYGDIYPITDMGRLISMVSSLFGIAIIAMPAGIVTAGFVDAINAEAKEEEEKVLQRQLEADNQELAKEQENAKQLAYIISRQQESLEYLEREIAHLEKALTMVKPQEGDDTK